MANADMAGYDISTHAIDVADRKSPPGITIRTGVTASDGDPTDLSSFVSISKCSSTWMTI